jgi:hypothetical protein
MGDLDDDYDELISFSDILGGGLQQNSEIIIIGYPIFDCKLYENCIYCSKGILSKKVGGPEQNF